jgi:hypothetical protein
LRARFERCFSSELQRLGEESESPVGPWQEENLLSALGAATFGEYELACALVETAANPPDHGRPVPKAPSRDLRRAPITIGALRRRFDRLRRPSGLR